MRRFISCLMVVVMVCMSCVLTGCGDSKQLQMMKAQYAALQAAPIQPMYTYMVTTPFYLMGKKIATAQELEKALANRPGLVVASVEKVVMHGDLMVRDDLEKAGYAFIGQQNRGKFVEMSFKDNSAAAMQTARAQRQQELAAAQSGIQMKQQEEASMLQTLTVVGGLIVTGVATVGGILAAQ